MTIEERKGYIVAAPSIWVLSRPNFDAGAVGAFLEQVGAGPWVEEEQATAADRLSEVAGRVCYMAFGEHQGRTRNSEYLANILKQGHGSTLEHAHWSFLITGVSRTLTHEFVRHRHWSASQLSQRYVDESEAQVVIPAVFAAVDESLTLKATVAESLGRGLGAYLTLVRALEAALPTTLSKRDRRIAARQAARCVLPNATATTLVASANGRAVRHFLEVRGSLYAEPEIRGLALALLPLVQADAPSMFQDMAVAVVDGVRCIAVGHRGV